MEERQNTFKSLAEDLAKFGGRPIAMEVCYNRVDFICKELDSTVSISYNPRWSAEYTDKAAEDIKGGDQWQKEQMFKESISEDLEEVEKPVPIVYVVTRCEEHSDYVEKVFFDGIKAEDYCKRFEGDENQYGRNITKVEVTL